MRLAVQRQQVYGDINPLDAQGVAIGCGPVPDDHESAGIAPEVELFGSTPKRRRLQHVQDAFACNNATNFFCWMQCLDIPNYQQAEGYVNEGYSLYCLDPAILARSGNQVSKAMAPCKGQIHNSNCMGVWTATAPGIPGQKVVYNSTASNYADVYCYGGTSMYMDGFHWIHESTCVIYLFPSWVLSSEGKFIAACLGTVAFGMLVEYIISRRRVSVMTMAAGYRRLIASAGFYGLQLAMGYLIMLVVMTYSAPLLLCCVFGLMAGHVLFNAKDAIATKKSTFAVDLAGALKDALQSTGIANTSDDETAPRLTPDDSSMGVQNCDCARLETNYQTPAMETDDEHHEIPEGSTPCCQNML